MNLRVLVVDDTIMYRKVVGDILAEMPGVEVVGTANNGKIALTRIASLKPDLITLDVEMPIMNGLETLEEIQKTYPDVGVIMLSTLTKRGSEITMRALELGAFDFITKPDAQVMQENVQLLRSALGPRIKVYAKRMELRALLKQRPRPVGAPAPAPAAPAVLASSRRMGKSKAVAIGISTGGPNALTKMLPQLPKLGVPIFVVQHMPPVFTKSLAESLDAKCQYEVREAENNEIVRPDVIYIAPGAKHMRVASGTGGAKIIQVTDDPPENNCKPAVDYMFRSVAREYGALSTGVIMTGMGGDGTLGLKVLKSFGAVTIGQDEESCVVYGMPKMAVEAGVVDVVSPLQMIASEIIRTVR
ncbi:MAG: chemotaxis response regulator protein-glutamate methylesterase [Desulfomicrobium sp.]|jgi:two-component system, chemotaxis family, protein-glutamate methylesterase/glutaminase|nr:chemotaxis response regulator protein-glutamate methylesterase [Pseudomonadota bacterium]MBV1710623.1 chemotaxis response regulator protein-glutamate methylesterase [Desulfomicrobium sp.]MBU4570231.1 chemotaxis response regulator protein-glutamate methylesterase [Pseudomonadota bacterium]MBU4593151.1 chemotaxis response regulator protein-glutamate methylesterase [Pseudomonadota bacterium]MBV1720365.1 chemotaxis response regulator protein-glutamate methylesterase [Desulfomicrobium sp.]